MGVTAENLAEQYKLTREEVDAFSLRFVDTPVIGEWLYIYRQISIFS